MAQFSEETEKKPKKTAQSRCHRHLRAITHSGIMLAYFVTVMYMTPLTPLDYGAHGAGPQISNSQIDTR